MNKRYIFITLCILVAIAGFFPDKESINYEKGSYLSEIAVSFLLAFIVSLLAYVFETVTTSIKMKLNNEMFLRKKKHINRLSVKRVFFFTGIIFAIFGLSNSIGHLFTYHILTGPGSVSLGFGCGFLLSRLLWWVTVDRHREGDLSGSNLEL